MCHAVEQHQPSVGNGDAARVNVSSTPLMASSAAATYANRSGNGESTDIGASAN